MHFGLLLLDGTHSITWLVRATHHYHSCEHLIRGCISRNEFPQTFHFDPGAFAFAKRIYVSDAFDF